MKANACVITGFGINADKELAQAFIEAGATADLIHIKDIIEDASVLHNYNILAFPGGFSYGDHLGAAKVLSYLVKKNLKDAIDAFVSKGGLVIGICNGFQTLVKMGVLPNTEGDWTQEVSLIHNDHGAFEDSWVTMKADQSSPCVWTKGIDVIDVPIRHGEGRFITMNADLRNKLKEQNLHALVYTSRNPNGSEDNVAGICDVTGRILGLMPHPEAFIYPEQHPQWRRKPNSSILGLELFKNAVQFVENSL